MTKISAIGCTILLKIIPESRKFYFLKKRLRKTYFIFQRDFIKYLLKEIQKKSL